MNPKMALQSAARMAMPKLRRKAASVRVDDSSALAGLSVKRLDRRESSARASRHAAFRDIAAGTDRDVELGAVAARQQRARPVVTDRQVKQLGSLIGDAGVARTIGKAQHAIGIGDVKLIAD